MLIHRCTRQMPEFIVSSDKWLEWQNSRMQNLLPSQPTGALQPGVTHRAATSAGSVTRHATPPEHVITVPSGGGGDLQVPFPYPPYPIQEHFVTKYVVGGFI